MLARKCDRCDKTYEHYFGHEMFGCKRVYGNAIGFLDFNITGDAYDQHKCYDLCPDCMTKLMGFLEGGKDVSN